MYTAVYSVRVDTISRETDIVLYPSRLRKIKCWTVWESQIRARRGYWAAKAFNRSIRMGFRALLSLYICCLQFYVKLDAEDVSSEEVWADNFFCEISVNIYLRRRCICCVPGDLIYKWISRPVGSKWGQRMLWHGIKRLTQVSIDVSSWTHT